MNFKSIQPTLIRAFRLGKLWRTKIIAALLLATTAATVHGSELIKPTSGLCLNGWYNKLTSTKTDVDNFFEKKYTPYLGGMVSWESDELKEFQLSVKEPKKWAGHVLKYLNDSAGSKDSQKPTELKELNFASGATRNINVPDTRPSLLSRAANYMFSTIKSDLGYGPRSFKQSGWLMHGVKQVATAARLLAYKRAINAIFISALATSGYGNVITENLNKTSQFKPMSLALLVTAAVLISPPLEEGIFTHATAPMLSYVGGERLGRIITPLLFGAMHYHENPIRWAFHVAQLAPLSYLNISHLQQNPDNILVPTLHHMMHNALAMWQIYGNK